MDQPRDVELFLYEEYSRRQFTPNVQRRIETIVNEGAQPLEEKLRSQLTSIIQECQDKIFTNYLRRKPTPCLSSVAMGAQIIPNTDIEAPRPRETTPNDLAHFCQRPPPPPLDVVELPISSASSSGHRYNSSADSGYASDISAFLSSQDSNKSTSDRSSTSSSRTSRTESAAPLPYFTFPDSGPSDKSLWQEEEEGLREVDSTTLLDISSFEDSISQDFDWDGVWNTGEGFGDFASTEKGS